MAIIHSPTRRTKPKKMDAKQRQLQADWEKLMSKHSKPLDRGAKANGLKVKPAPQTAVEAVQFEPSVRTANKGFKMMGAATVPVRDELADAKKALSSRIGQSYNKGGLQYLTDDEIEEQRTGAHKRR